MLRAQVALETSVRQSHPGGNRMSVPVARGGQVGRHKLAVARGLSVVLAAWFCLVGSLSAAPKKKPNVGDTSRTTRRAAVASIPMKALPPAAAAKVKKVVGKSSIFRRLPLAVTQSEPRLYSFLVRHPEVVANVWEVMGISKVAVQRIGPGRFKASDGAGTLCTMEFLYSHRGTHVIYAEGKYEGPLLHRAVSGKCVLVLKSAAVLETDGRHYVTSRLDFFMLLDHGGIQLVAKAIMPLVGRTTDYNFLETASFLGRISRSAEVKPAGMHKMAARLKKVTPEVRSEFLKQVDRVATSSSKTASKAKKTSVRTAAASPPGGSSRRRKSPR